MLRYIVIVAPETLLMRVAHTGDRRGAAARYLRPAIIALLLLVTVAALALLAGAAGAVPPPDFTVVVLPDTQGYVVNSSYDPLFAAQTQWVVDTRNTLNTRFVTHLGDITEHGDQYDVEWKRASTHMATLDRNGVPNNVLPGNHDMN